MRLRDHVIGPNLHAHTLNQRAATAAHICHVTQQQRCVCVCVWGTRDINTNHRERHTITIARPSVKCKHRPNQLITTLQLRDHGSRARCAIDRRDRRDRSLSLSLSCALSRERTRDHGRRQRDAPQTTTQRAWGAARTTLAGGAHSHEMFARGARVPRTHERLNRTALHHTTYTHARFQANTHTHIHTHNWFESQFTQNSRAHARRTHATRKVSVCMLLCVNVCW